MALPGALIKATLVQRLHRVACLPHTLTSLKLGVNIMLWAWGLLTCRDSTLNETQRHIIWLTSPRRVTVLGEHIMSLLAVTIAPLMPIDR